MYSNVLLAGSVNFFNTCPEVSIWHLHLHLSYYTCMYESAISIQPAHPVRLVKWLVPGWVTMSCGHGMTLHQTCHGTSHGSSDPCWWPLQFFPVSSMLHARQIQGGGSKCRNIRFSLPKQKSCSAAYFLSWQQFSVGREIHWKVTKPQLMFHPFETIVGYD